jgi:hypothetical protein
MAIANYIPQILELDAQFRKVARQYAELRRLTKEVERREQEFADLGNLSRFDRA